jgi:hypothetical protein
MRDAEFMSIEDRMREGVGECPYTPGVVEVNVRYEDVPDLIRRDARGADSREECFTARGRTRLHERPAVLFRKEIGCDEALRISKIDIYELATHTEFENAGTRHGRSTQG